MVWRKKIGLKINLVPKTIWLKNWSEKSIVPIKFRQIVFGEPSKVRSGESWEKFPSGADPPPPTLLGTFLNLGTFWNWMTPPKTPKQVENGKFGNKINPLSLR